MADGADLLLDSRQLDRDMDRMVRQHLAAGTSAVSGTTKALERALEAATRGAVPGRLWRAWGSRAYPERGPARNPAGEVFVNGKDRTRGAIEFWTRPGEVRGKRGQFLAVPLPAAGPRGRARDLSPAEWERRHPGVKLRFVARPGRAALLVADDAVLSGKKQVARRNTDRRIAAGQRSATVPIFVLLPMAKFGNSVAVDPLVKRAEGDLVRAFLAETAAIK
ncbi:MAG: DUF6441 family protein [Pseudomonadota bacterium]|nr:DUF6441 family protein [Pseudomonadota bacterium]